MSLKIKIPAIAGIMLLVVLSCSDNFSPFDEFKEEYSLFCVLKTDTTLQSAYLSKSYRAEDFDPLKIDTDPFLEGAVVKLIVNGSKEYLFQKSSVPRNDTSRFKTPFNFYSINNYKPAGFDVVKLEAVLPNGTKLTSELDIPPVEYLLYNNATYYYFPRLTDKSSLGIKFGWTLSMNSEFITNFYFFPQLDIVYSKSDAPGVRLRARVPLYFFDMHGSQMPVFPNVSRANNVWFYHDAIEKILDKISEGDLEKSNYTVYGAEFSLLFIEKGLAQYISSMNTFSDEFSVRIDAADYTNIRNGLGLFGSYAVKKTKIQFEQSFVTSFGYKNGK